MSHSGMRASGVGFQVFGSQLSGFGFQISSFGFIVSGFRLRVSGFGIRVSNFGKRFGCRNLGREVLDPGLESHDLVVLLDHQVLVVRHR